MNKRNAPIIITVSIIVLLALGYFLVWPKYTEFKATRLEFEFKDEEIIAKEDYLPKLNRLIRQTEEMSDKIDIVQSALPTDPSAAALFDYLKVASSQSGLILADISVNDLFVIEEEEDVSSMINEIVFNAELVGTYESFKIFLSEIYKSSRIIEVESIDLVRAVEEEGASDNLLNYKIKFKTHLYGK